jgi:hypothetical protein
MLGPMCFHSVRRSMRWLQDGPHLSGTVRLISLPQFSSMTPRLYEHRSRKCLLPWTGLKKAVIPSSRLIVGSPLAM